MASGAVLMSVLVKAMRLVSESKMVWGWGYAKALGLALQMEKA